MYIYLCNIWGSKSWQGFDSSYCEEQRRLLVPQFKSQFIITARQFLCQDEMAGLGRDGIQKQEVIALLIHIKFFLTIITFVLVKHNWVFSILKNLMEIVHIVFSLYLFSHLFVHFWIYSHNILITSFESKTLGNSINNVQIFPLSRGLKPNGRHK